MYDTCAACCQSAHHPDKATAADTARALATCKIIRSIVRLLPPRVTIPRCSCSLVAIHTVARGCLPSSFLFLFGTLPPGKVWSLRLNSRGKDATRTTSVSTQATTAVAMVAPPTVVALTTAAALTVAAARATTMAARSRAIEAGEQQTNPYELSRVCFSFFEHACMRGQQCMTPRSPPCRCPYVAWRRPPFLQLGRVVNFFPDVRRRRHLRNYQHVLRAKRKRKRKRKRSKQWRLVGWQSTWGRRGLGRRSSLFYRNSHGIYH